MKSFGKDEPKPAALCSALLGPRLRCLFLICVWADLGVLDRHFNLPIILVGGGFKHGQHLAFDKTNNYPLSNLYVTMLQRLGLETAKFSSSTGTMKGLELA